MWFATWADPLGVRNVWMKNLLLKQNLCVNLSLILLSSIVTFISIECYMITA